MTVEIEQVPTTGINDVEQSDRLGETAEASEKQPGGDDSGAAPTSPAAESQKPATNRIYVYAAVAVGFGVLLGAMFAAIAWQRSGQHDPAQLGSVTSSADGLTGHLALNWADALNYQLVVAPSDPLRRAEFSLAASSSPRPVSFYIRLKDSAGSALCDQTIVLKFDPRQAAGQISGPQAGTGIAADAPTDQVAQGFDVAQAEAAELKREYGQDIFQGSAGPDGQVVSINAQGKLPCSKQAYEQAASWSFSSNFPTLAEQSELLKRQLDLTAAADAATANASAASIAPAHRRKPKLLAQPATVAYGIEGDDELVAFDTTRGIVETSTRKFFVVGKPIAADNSAAWQDIPADVHYKCDLNGLCSLRRRGAAILYAQWKR